VEFFTKALKEISPKRRAQRGDWRTNLGKALYLSGEKKKGVAEILAGIRDVQKYRREVDSYTFNVWLSGGYIRLAEVLAEASPARAAEYLRKATEIVEADPSQVVRKVQLKNFMATGSSGL
jgi:hypothetical protein